MDRSTWYATSWPSVVLATPCLVCPTRWAETMVFFFFSKKYFECLVNVVLHRSLLDLSYCYYKHWCIQYVQSIHGRSFTLPLPPQVTTVDRYQGQQNDYIILSLVRTKHVGHLRDVRRLVVAMSRARLGLYVFARVGLFNTCTELQPAFRLVSEWVGGCFLRIFGRQRLICTIHIILCAAHVIVWLLYNQIKNNSGTCMVLF